MIYFIPGNEVAFFTFMSEGIKMDLENQAFFDIKIRTASFFKKGKNVDFFK